MAANYRGRTGSSWFSGGATQGRSTRPGTSSHTSTSTRGTGRQTNCAPGYGEIWNKFQRKINSFRTLWNQTRGTAKFSRPSPTTLNSFANWINKGAFVCTMTPAQISQWCPQSTRGDYKWDSPTSCRQFLSRKFGKQSIKAFARDKSGAYMIAFAPTVKAKGFNLGG